MAAQRADGMFLRHTFTAVRVLQKSWVRSKSGMFFSLLFPVMLLLIFGSIFGNQSAVKYSIFIQNNDIENGTATNLSAGFVETLGSTGIFDISTLDAGTNITDFARSRTTFGSDRFLVIPRGFQSDIINRSIHVRVGITLDTLGYFENQSGAALNESERQGISELKGGLEEWRNGTVAGNRTQLLLLVNPEDQSAGPIRGILASIADEFNNHLTGADPVIALKSGSVSQKMMNAADYYLPGYIAAFVMTNGIIGVTSTVSESRRNGSLKRLVATPLSRPAWVLGNIIHQALLAFLLMIVMVSLSMLIFGTRPTIDIVVLLLVFMGAVAFCAIGMTLGGGIKDVEAAVGAGNAIAFPMMFLSGAFWPLEMMPAYMQFIAKIFPLYYFHDGLRSAMIYGNSTVILQSFAVLLITAGIFLAIGTRLTKWKDLE